ncbi:tRNA (adenosine(37)-N6)-threonylcarbamoyltransferase complex ATPase subunit type 1 TsaE [Bacillus lacus]|uniref:tRNA threonylcarbamoyladenosine biosynthesis protein TsaE n=1 Tax=Metabacillus lacus TaxID=1983721 RepID=A0A7X2J027_9BACI|nr:tRNA (adenosine(37)-N6)-threonylcarbamoyltransferase complex ATPase subunit type 1 TsaE [Metabacillus lacus]MRX72759.1 tRNA (adenosine(37)-N6)-threonylcarbamoyltransferase complex ATPase subunit type 1 TsaE [Metabacillus lacus]
MEWNLKTENPEETAAFAMKLAERLEQGDVLTLEGDLGAGKTTFTKALAKGLGIERNVNSPTFTIIKEYHGGRLPLYHMDVYRMEEDSEDLGFHEYFEGEGVTVVEWAHLIHEYLPDNRLEVQIFHVGETERRLTVKAFGPRYINLGKELLG